MKFEYNFLIRYILIFIPVKLITYLMTPITIYGVYLLLKNYNPGLSGINLTINNISFTFIEACISSYAYYLLLFLVLTTKDISFVKRVYTLLIGFLLVLVMNYIRIVGLIIGTIKFGFDWFNTVHLLIWALFSWVYVFLVWIFLIKVFKIKSIPLYDDFKYLYKRSLFKKN